MERRLAAILAIDMVGYSRLMETDESGTITRQKVHRENFIDPQIDRYTGRIVKTTGDGLLAEFPSVVDAVDCALAFQSALSDEEQNISEEQRILYRAGINLGDIVIDGDDILGDGVNVAARLETIAPPGGLCVSDMVRQNLRGAVGDSFEDMGEQILKNIERKVRVWRWPAADEDATQPSGPTASDSKGNSPLTIAVLPFETLSADVDHHFYADGFAEDIATAISKLDTLHVVSIGSNGSASAARYHVEGSIRISGPRIRCNVQLIEIADGHHLWSEKFDGQVEDIFEFQDQITDQVVAALEIELTEGQQVRLWHREASDPLAYEDFLKGRAAYKEYSRPGNARARTSYQAALDRSPAFLSAAVGLARTHIEDATFGWSADREQSLQEARRLLDGVFAIEPDHASAHMELSHVLMVDGEFPAARLEGELAVALDPNSADAHQCLAHILVCHELPEEALRSARRAISLNPGTPEFYFISMAEAFIALERYQEALAVSEKMIARRPGWIMARILNALALHGLGKESEARKEIQNLIEISPSFTASRWQRIIFYPDRPDIPDLIERLVSVGLPA
ncbi:MAG: tetratricopeptide repeat protein [Alphaproteobacteria bacterium]|nr:tetratricopeptide repeat protein [Alphaproteobacteria bacterium]